MADFEISEAQVPPEALAAFSNEASPAPIANEVEVDPVDTLDAAGLFELSKNKMFSPLEYAQQNPEKATNVDVVRKLADTHARIRERGFTFSDLPSVGEAAKGVGHMIAGGAKQLWNYANAFIGVPLAGIAGEITGQLPTFSEELTQDAQRRMIETAAGTEAAITGLSQLPGRAVSKAVHRLGTASGLGKTYDQQTEQEKSKAFFDDLGKAQAAGEIAQGRGGLVGTISGETQKELAAAGKPIRPEEVGTLAAGDPLSFILFGKAFGAAGGAASRVLPKTGVGAALVEKAGEAATTIGGRAIQTAGKITEFGGAATKVTGKVLPIVGALKGAALAGPSVGLTGGLAAGAVAGRAAGRIGQTVGAAGERLAGFGEQVATGVGLTPYSQAARDILAASPIVASETLKGGAFDLALAAATSESPQETEAAAAFGTVLGGLKGVGRGALKVAQGQIITPRPWGSPKVTPAYGSFAALDALHSQASVSAAPGQALRANAIREFLSGTGDKVQAYLMPDAAAMEKAVTDILVRQGESPAVAQANARNAAQAKGMFTRELIDDAGNSRRVVLLNEADAAPHEAFHGIQDVLGESANQIVDGLVFQEYAPQWEAIGQQYAQRLGGTGSWREIILDRTGWGNAASAEKALRDAANKIEGETGAVARPEDVRAMAQGVLTEARRNGAGWRDILTPEEATAEANRYLARELAAENFDAAFKALGSGLVEGNTLPEALARVIARTAQFMGVEPLAGARTEGLRIEPRLAVTETVTGLGRSLVEPAQARATRLQEEQTQRESAIIQTEAEKTLADAEAKQAKAKTVEEKRKASQALIEARTGLIQARTEKVRAASEREAEKWARKSTTPEVAATEADQVMSWLQTASIPVANRAAAAQTLAQAMQNQQGVRLTYFGAKGEPGGDPAALRPARRAEIEAQRDAPNADRPIVTKDYFPYGAIITSKGPQFKGWSPNNFNANVTRFADWLAANPEAASRVPLAHDLTTEAGKRGLQADLQTFIQNQMAGFTGSGLEMVVPEGTGATAPVRTGVQPVALPQERADAISYLFNLKLPETPRITAGKLPLNIVGQRVSEATLPGRVVEPVRERGAFAGPQAEALGIAGEQIREVNPFRQTVEQAAKDAGIKPPELIEAAQILALDRIAYAEGAPELPQFGGNVVTLTAGFLPGEITQRGREILAMTPDEFQARARDWNGGLTGEAKRVGLGATSIEDVNTLRQFEAEAKAKGSAAMKTRDFDTAMSQASISQFFREAREAATGEGGVGEALRRDLGEGYVPPVSESAPTAETGAQFLPGGDYDYLFFSKKSAEKFVPELARLPDGFFQNKISTLLKAAAPGTKAWVIQNGGEKVLQDAAQRLDNKEFAPFQEGKLPIPVANAAKYLIDSWKLERHPEEFASTLKRSREQDIAFENVQKGSDAMGVKVLLKRPGGLLGEFEPTAFPPARAEASPLNSLTGTGFESHRELLSTLLNPEFGKTPEFLKISSISKLLENRKTLTPAERKLAGELLNEEKRKILEVAEAFDGTRRGGRIGQEFDVGEVDTAVAEAGVRSNFRTEEERIGALLGQVAEDWFSRGGFKTKRSAYDAVRETAENLVKEKNNLRWETGFYREPTALEGAKQTVVDFWKNSQLAKKIASWRQNRKLESTSVPEPFLTQKSLEQVDWGRAVFDLLEANPDVVKTLGREVDIRAVADKLTLAPETPLNSLPAKEQKIASELFKYGREQLQDFGISPVQFLPKGRKPKNEFKILPAGAAGISKAWVLPGGKVEQLGPQWHHDWLDKNKAVQEKYGLEVPAFEGGDAEGVREAALKKGFVRVNYSRNTGTLTVEARAQNWRRQKVAVEKLIEENLDDIDNVTVHLMDENVQRVVDSASERLFNYDSDVEKMANLPFITKGEVRGGSQFLPSENKVFTDELKKIRNGESGGQTFNSDGSIWQPPAEPSDIVTLASTTIPREKLTGAEFEKATEPYQELLQQPNIAAGVFSFERAGEPVASIDINAVVPQTFRDNTLAFARANDQVAIWDAAKNETVNAGGSGNTRITSPEHMRTAAEALKEGEPVDVAAMLGQSPVVEKPPATYEELIRQAESAEFFANRALDNPGLSKKLKNVEAAGWKSQAARLRQEAKLLLSGETTGQFLPAEQAGLPGITSGREYDRKAIEGMSQAQLKEYFPESIIPKKNTEKIPSKITDSPLSKSAGSREAAVQAFSDKLVKFYREREDNPALQAGAKWYSEFTPLLKKEFGKDSRIFAELLAATSPNNKPDVNFAFALDALQNWKAGKYDKMISKFNEGLNKLPDGGLQRIYERDLKAGKVTDPPEKPSDATYLAHWIEKHNLIPRSSSGGRFSMHSVPVLKVLARKWLELNTGLKTDNFIKNLVGEGDEATIDVWADRTMRRLGYEGFRPRWRIMPRNKTGVTDEDFVFSQQAFRMAAEEIGIKPSALQGALWFAEKQLWSERGWGKLDLGDYRTELEKMPQLRAGFASREARARAEAEAGESEQLEILPR